MSVLLILIFASLIIAGVFLVCFIWAVNAGQFEDTCTPSMRILTDEDSVGRKFSHPTNTKSKSP